MYDVSSVKPISIYVLQLREQPFDFYGGGGAGRLRKKNFPALISGKKNHPEGRQKKFYGLT